ncbi:radical SAM protein [Candidatus Halobeggiatoa sp. HSG11]|nr:radical SAM protein [Candidatus Halobeggiatoa sp. HSG11]
MNTTPASMLLQWHITERCNLRCSHCYQDNYQRNELSFTALIDILEQFKQLLKVCSKYHGKQIKAHITITGGEPFIRNDFLDLLEIFAANSQLFSFAILTNGAFIDDSKAKLLHTLNPAFVQVSIEGTEATHDSIRGKGNFTQTVTAIKRLRDNDIRTMISFTAHRKNFREFKEVAKLGQKLRVNKVWSDRLIPWGNAKEQVMSQAETKEFFEIMSQAKNRITWFNNTEIAMHRALQFLVAGGKPYKCTAGNTLLTVQANGDLYPCRRLPIKAGNLTESNLLELYYNSEVLHNLRQHKVSDGCKKCLFAKACRGGLRCLSYAITGDPFKADPGCWLKSE